MTIEELKRRGFENEFRFTASRSKGPGGQNVNKVNSKIELRFDIRSSELLKDGEKQLLLLSKSQYLTKSGELVFASQESRSQITNKTAAIENFYSFIVIALKIAKRRKPTKPTLSSIKKRLEKKRSLSELKKQRRKPNW